MVELELWPNCYLADTLKSYDMLFGISLFPCFLLKMKFILEWLHEDLGTILEIS